MIVVHAADIHLDSPLVGLTRYEGAPVGRIRGATRGALSNLVDLCIERGAALLLIAGDLYDGNWRDYSTGLYFVRQMARLREAGIRVAMVRGNHDAASQITKSLRLPDNVTDLATAAPQTVVFEDIGIACHGQGFARRAVTEDLAARYPAAVSGLLNIGILHTALGGREGHERYAPTSVEVLAARGYDYWALGHVHEREVLSEAPWVVFPGNLQGRHARETGPKGATVIAVEDQRIASVEPVALDVVRFARARVTTSELARADDLLARVQGAVEEVLSGGEGRLVAVRVELVGGGPVAAAVTADPARWDNEIRALGADVGGEDIWIEKLGVRGLSPVSDATGPGSSDLFGQLVAAVRKARSDPEELAELRAAIRELTHRLPTEVDGVDPALRALDDAAMAELLADVEKLLIVRLSQGTPAR